MAMKFPYANHLTNEEVDYELVLRNQLEERQKDMPVKLRLLRKLFQEDKKTGREYRAPYQFETEVDLVTSRVDQIERLLYDGAHPNLLSRLRHYYLRVQRNVAANEGGEKARQRLLNRIEELLLKTASKLPPSDTEDEGAAAELLRREEEDDALAGTGKTGGTLGNVSLGAIPKTTQTSDPKTQGQAAAPQPSYEEMQSRVWELERQVDRLQRLALVSACAPGNAGTAGLSPQRHQRQEGSRELGLHEGRSNPQGNAPQRRGFSSESEEEGIQTSRTGWQRSRMGQSTRMREDRYDSRGSSYSSRRGVQEPRHYRRIEHWKLFFSGDAKSVSVENFLYKLKKIAGREGVSDNSLLRDIHLVLEGQASDWFFTYVDEFENWDDFEERIRYRFGNPNQDQGIRLRIQERKQQRGEAFIAFVTEIERLNKMLSTPLSRRRKFEVVWDNMRQHYRSKIATISVRDLDHLIRLNHGIDAADLNLQHFPESRGQRNVCRVECNQSDSGSDGGEEIDAINTMREHNGGRMSNRVGQTSQQAPEPVRQGACWNCKKLGHNWRDCQEPRRIFCYGCGELGQTIRSCGRCARKDGGQFRQRQGNW